MKKRENPVIQRVSDPFDDLVMDSNKSLRMNDVMIVMGRASGKQDAIEKMVMDIPNNSILKNGEIKESKPRKK